MDRIKDRIDLAPSVRADECVPLRLAHFILGIIGVLDVLYQRVDYLLDGQDELRTGILVLFSAVVDAHDYLDELFVAPFDALVFAKELFSQPNLQHSIDELVWELFCNRSQHLNDLLLDVVFLLNEFLRHQLPLLFGIDVLIIGLDGVLNGLRVLIMIPEDAASREVVVAPLEEHHVVPAVDARYLNLGQLHQHVLLHLLEWIAIEEPMILREELVFFLVLGVLIQFLELAQLLGGYLLLIDFVGVHVFI